MEILADGVWTEAIGAVIDDDGRVRGTAFYIGEDVALTCAHVLSAAGSRSISIKSVGAGFAEHIIESRSDPELDVAIVRVQKSNERQTLRLSSGGALIGGKIYSRGYPRDHNLSKYPNGFPMDPSEVTGSTTLDWRNRKVRLLVLSGAGGAKHGMSGAPALDLNTHTVIGIMRFSEVDAERVYAIPVETLLTRWPDLMSGNAGRGPRYQDIVFSIPERLAATAWSEFIPDFLHCVTVNSERHAPGSVEDSLDDVFRDLLSSHHAPRLWNAFAESWKDSILLRTTKSRNIPSGYDRGSVRLASIEISEAFANLESLEMAVRLIVEADLALFDVTGFQPGVMLLLGIRAATKRGVTINSHGGGWREGEPLRRPFNLSDLSLASHSRSGESFVGDDPRLSPLAERLCTGFVQLTRQPNYQDLPVYDALRRLGSAEDAWISIPIDREVLVLCPYDEQYFSRWIALRRRVGEALSEAGIRPAIVRLQDIPTPQLVSQSLYERIRRCAGCLADWTGSSPSTFFELGARLAVSPYDSVQIVDRHWLEGSTTSAGELANSSQIRRMAKLLNPMIYDGPRDSSIGLRIANQLVEVRQQRPGLTGNLIRQVAAKAVSATQVRLPDVVSQLRRDADMLNHPARTRNNIPQTLYFEVREIKAEEERAALERRLAAWLYLEYITKAGDLDVADDRRQAWAELGSSVASDLFLSDDAPDLAMAERIYSRFSEDRHQAAILYRRKGDSLMRSGHRDEANGAYSQALALLDEVLSNLPASLLKDGKRIPIFAAEAAELWGERGGILRRQGALGPALSSYRKGASYEETHRLPGTYNRLNALKLTLMIGESRLSELTDELVALRDTLADRLGTDERAADDAWLWADLGDIKLLLDDVTGAELAYKSFIDRARTDSPDVTLSVLKDLLDRLDENGDPSALRLRASATYIESVLV